MGAELGNSEEDDYFFFTHTHPGFMEIPDLEQVGIKVEGNFKLDEFRNMVIAQGLNYYTGLKNVIVLD